MEIDHRQSSVKKPVKKKASVSNVTPRGATTATATTTGIRSKKHVPEPVKQATPTIHKTPPHKLMNDGSGDDNGSSSESECENRRTKQATIDKTDQGNYSYINGFIKII